MPVLPQPQPQAFDKLMQAQAQALHADDQPAKTRPAWQERRTALRRAMFQAMGPFPEKPCDLEPRVVGVLKRPGYRIEKVVFQSRPDMWVSSSLYLPDKVQGRAPAVLVVHGHWAGARRDPVVQARCLGLVQLGFAVLAVDAFGSGERFTRPALGTYHGSLYGSTLWPTGQTLLGMQVYDNQRAVDYLRTRPEVDGTKLGITGASGGGNQSMYAGALDERIQAVVPVCSVGTYQSYLRTACCVCEVLPGALRFTEESDVLALVAPRALLVINATQDGIQFSVGESSKSIARARPIFDLFEAGEKIRHATFESPHAYNQAMRETMYGWMTRWLKNEGKGEPIPEPKHEVEKPIDLACFPDLKRPAGFLLPPTMAGRLGQQLVQRANATRPTHPQAWEATSMANREQLRRQVFGEFPSIKPVPPKVGKPTSEAGVDTTPIIFSPEPDMPVPALFKKKAGGEKGQPACVLLHLDGKEEALKHPIAPALLQRGAALLVPDLRATGETKLAGDAIVGALDHNSAEHGLWIGRPLLGQWVFDVQHLLDWLGTQPGIDRRKVSVIGLGQAGIVALCASALFTESVHGVATVGTFASLVTNEPYPSGMRMGLLAPGLLQVGDVPHLAALSAPRKVHIVEAVSLPGKALGERELRESFAFTQDVYRVHKAEQALGLAASWNDKELDRFLS